MNVTSGTGSYPSPTELAYCPSTHDAQATTVQERPSAADDGSRSAVETGEVHLNQAFTDDTITPHQAIYANTSELTDEDFVELY